MLVSRRHVFALSALACFAFSDRAFAGNPVPNPMPMPQPVKPAPMPVFKLPNVSTPGPIIANPRVSIGGVSKSGGVDINITHNVKLPTVNVVGPNVQVVVPNIQVASGGSSFFVSSAGSGIAGSSVGGVVVTNQNADPVPASLIENLSVGGETITEQVAVKDFVTRDIITNDSFAIRAECLDAQGHLNPASQVFGGANVGKDYSGEVYRCLQGSSMRVTMARIVNGVPAWNEATSFDCVKGQALSYSGGEIQCKQQLAARECNERSLLRKYGPGDKIAYFRGTRQVRDMITRYETRQREVVKPVGNLALDGGVGQGVY